MKLLSKNDNPHGIDLPNDKPDGYYCKFKSRAL